MAAHPAKLAAMSHLETVLRRCVDELTSLPGVVGAAEGQQAGRPCIRVFVETNDAEGTKRIPSEFEGYPVVVERHGELRALGESQAAPPTPG